MGTKKKTSSDALNIIPLGGLGEIGMNMMAYEYAGKILVVDCGLTFPASDTPGVDLVIPDISYLVENREKLVGLVFTHGHEDHIGASPYIWPELQVPIYGTPMTLGLLEGKFREHRLLDKAEMFRVDFRQKIQLGPFLVQFMRVTHSIVDAAALAITTPLGTVIHTGDFKFDHTPVGGRATDLYSLAKHGERGVLALLSDSTNVTKPGSTTTEQVIAPHFDQLFNQQDGLIVVATFSSNIQRIQQVFDAALKVGRKVVVNGRSMMNTVQVARSLGYLKIADENLVDVKSFKKYQRSKLVLLSTGSQGEPNASLVRIANGDHRDIRITDGDRVIFSSKFIPGNERAIWTLINDLFKQGADVVHVKNLPEIHVSGHAPDEDLKLMMALTRPKFFIPIHGEMHHLYRHRDLARSMGVPSEKSLVMENGNVVRLDGRSVEVVDQVPTGRVFVDGSQVGDVGEVVLRDRRIISEDGMVMVMIITDESASKPLREPVIVTRGVVYEDESQELLLDARKAVEKAFEVGPKGMDFRGDEEVGLDALALRALRRFFKKRLGRRPLVLPIIVPM
ncbi:MAG: ribonuclease J [Magnetococcales bacterium]|nr:ribonuclease J [Magnetococcales bacterium]